jgi:hypothetical protein
MLSAVGAGDGDGDGDVPGQGSGGEGREHSPVVSKKGSSPGKPGSRRISPSMGSSRISPSMSSSKKFDVMMAGSKPFESILAMGVTDKEVRIVHASPPF